MAGCPPLIGCLPCFPNDCQDNRKNRPGRRWAFGRDELPQRAMVEQQIVVEILAIDDDAELPGDEGKTDSQFEE